MPFGAVMQTNLRHKCKYCYNKRTKAMKCFEKQRGHAILNNRKQNCSKSRAALAHSLPTIFIPTILPKNSIRLKVHCTDCKYKQIVIGLNNYNISATVALCIPYGTNSATVA